MKTTLTPAQEIHEALKVERNNPAFVNYLRANGIEDASDQVVYEYLKTDAQRAVRET
jgi:hypothetical protein